MMVGGEGVNSSTDACDILGLCSGVQLRLPFFLVMAPRHSVIGTQVLGQGGGSVYSIRVFERSILEAGTTALFRYMGHPSTH